MSYLFVKYGKKKAEGYFSTETDTELVLISKKGKPIIIPKKLIETTFGISNEEARERNSR
jgi:hypothetical protein